jgi:hypothetical protein
MSDEEGGLYGDLLDTKPAASSGIQVTNNTPSASAISSLNSTSDNRPLSLMEQSKLMEDRVALLEQENLQLKRNIGTLYRTAKQEISRKDGQISRLMKDLDQKS